MDLQNIVENTPKILAETAVFGIVFYPTFSAVKSVLDRTNFVNNLKNPQTAYFTLGTIVGKLIFEYASLVSK